MNAGTTSTPITLLRWIARGLGLTVAGMTGVFFAAHLGEFVAGGSLPPVGAWISMLLLLTITAGYLLVWKYEVAGALMAIAGALLLFPRAGEHFLLYAGIASLPAFLLLVCRFWPPSETNRRSILSQRTKRIVMSAGIAVPLTLAGLFVLELFTHHGTPYTVETLPEALAGTWSGTGIVRVDPETNERTMTAVTLTVHSDGSVSGRIGDTPIVDAEAQKNRSWFYRKINFYSDYHIEGTCSGEIEPGDGLDGEHLRIPCNIRDGALKGTIFHTTRWSYKPVVNHLALTKEGQPEDWGG